LTIRVTLKDRDYSAALFDTQPHKEKGYLIISGMLVLKGGKKESIQENLIKVDRIHIYSKNEEHIYEDMGEKIAGSLYNLFSTTMTKKGQGERVTIKEILEENEKKLDKKIIALSVNLY
jgi:hypothetical protein